jgi:hypothetical protein
MAGHRSGHFVFAVWVLVDPVVRPITRGWDKRCGGDFKIGDAAHRMMTMAGWRLSALSKLPQLIKLDHKAYPRRNCRKETESTHY